MLKQTGIPESKASKKRLIRLNLFALMFQTMTSSILVTYASS